MFCSQRQFAFACVAAWASLSSRRAVRRGMGARRWAWARRPRLSLVAIAIVRTWQRLRRGMCKRNVVVAVNFYVIIIIRDDESVVHRSARYDHKFSAKIVFFSHIKPTNNNNLYDYFSPSRTSLLRWGCHQPIIIAASRYGPVGLCKRCCLAERAARTTNQTRSISYD